MVLTVGSFAMNACEPGQVRKEAAVSKIFHVPKGSLTRANDKRAAWIATANSRCTVLFLTKVVRNTSTIALQKTQSIIDVFLSYIETFVIV